MRPLPRILPAAPCRCHPGFRQDAAPGGLFMSCGQTLMDDYSSTARVIRTADRLLTVTWPSVPFDCRVVRVHVSTLPFVQQWLQEEREVHCLLLLFFPPLSFFLQSPSCLLLVVFVYAACSRVGMHQSDKVSPCVRMKERARQTEGKAKWQMRGRELCYSCAPVCLHFVSFPSLCQCGCAVNSTSVAVLHWLGTNTELETRVKHDRSPTTIVWYLFFNF